VHAAQRRTLIEQLIRVLLGLWSSYDDWDDDDLMNTVAAQSALIVTRALSNARRLQRSYDRAVFDEFGLEYDRETRSLDVYPRSGVSALEVYRRPAKTYRWQRTLGLDEQEARDAALQRVVDIATHDVAKAEQDDSGRTYSSTTTTIAWRRVVRPERSMHGPCGLCIVASSRIYRSSDLMPLHNGCVCDKMPITAEHDPGLELNRADIDRIYEAAGGNTAAELQRTRVIVREHGELGPVLVREGDHFRDAAEAGAAPYNAPTLESDRAAGQKALASVQGSIDRLRERLATGDGSDLRIRRAIRDNETYLADLTRRLAA